MYSLCSEHCTMVPVYLQWGIEIRVLVLIIVWNHVTLIGTSTDTSLTEGSQNISTIYEARVDIRKLSQFIQGQFNPTKIICSKLYCTLTPSP